MQNKTLKFSKTRVNSENNGEIKNRNLEKIDN